MAHSQYIAAAAAVEQGAGSEQEAGSREQGAGSRDTWATVAVPVFLKIKDLVCTWGVQPVHVMGYCGRSSSFCMLCRSKILHGFIFVLLAVASTNLWALWASQLLLVLLSSCLNLEDSQLVRTGLL